MATRGFTCPRCGEPVEAEGADRDVGCSRCGTWFHAYDCERCGRPFVAVDAGGQRCPWCGTKQPFRGDRVRTFDVVDDPLPLGLDPAVPTGAYVPAGPDDVEQFGSLLTWILAIAAMAVVVIGAWATVETGRVLAHHHGNVVLGVVEVASGTVVLAAILSALALLVEQAAESRRQLDELLRLAQPTVPPDGVGPSA